MESSTQTAGISRTRRWIGGAVASQVRIGSPLFSHTLFPIYVGLLIWGGLYLRESRLHALIPVR